MSNLFHWTQPRNHYLHRHEWSQKDGLEMQQFRQSLSNQAKVNFSEIQGELLGHRYVTEVRGYQEVFHADSKSIRQGLDGIYFDPQKQELVIAEFKGQTSRLSHQQKQPEWTIETCEKIQHGKFPYHRVSEYEREFAQVVLEHHNRGELIRHEVIRTEVDMQSGQWWSQLEQQTYLEKSLETPYPAQTLQPEQDFGIGT